MIWQILLIALGGGIFVFGLFYPKRWHKGWLDGGWPDFDDFAVVCDENFTYFRWFDAYLYGRLGIYFLRRWLV
ncbi:hypothetical protein [Listeria booriae]|uniref:hypothetical protein n=1 Tax=Listeria booriae TaxID=1552123 RepID=UPI0016294D00|nr:hypothetical protein [Listeria booriae]MBC1511678.1 hypothetical protein [Listeria booriae]MBC6150419.1 hypothetical protein [Listeria booriae]MBC6304724.1 hypothetical protein [Listeria booriae]